MTVDLVDLCPSCGEPTDAVTALELDDDARPKPGDLGICFYCGAFATFDERLRRRRPTAEEAAAFAADPRAQAVRAQILRRLRP